MENLDAESITTLVKGGVATLSVALGSKPAALLIEKISNAIGWYVEPQKILRNARAEAAATIIKAEAEQEIKTLEQRAAARIIYEETKAQQNIENIVLNALSNIRDDGRPNDIDNDWLVNFFDKCRRVSNEDMQNLWSQILAGEVNEPGTYSPKTLHLLSILTKEDALAFRRLCTYVWTDEENTPVLIATQKVIEEETTYKIISRDVYRCQEVDLISFDALTESRLMGKNIYFMYKNRRFDIVQILEDGLSTTDVNNIPAGYIKLTLEGRELARICNPEPNWEYMEHVLERWNAKNYKSTEFIS